MPRRPRSFDWFWLTPFAAVAVVFGVYLTATYPLIGHDYEIFFRYLAEGRWQFAHHGLAPLYYAVHLCGGLPLYGQPNDLWYSPAQAFALLTDPWHASLAAFFLFLAAGYAGWYRLGRDVFRLEQPWAHALALIVAAHGFHLAHAVAGHVNFATMPLLGWMAWLLLSRGGPGPAARAAWFALACGVTLHAAGYFTLVFFALFAAMLLPLAFAFPGHLCVAGRRELLARCAVLAAAATLLCASKLTAVFSLMRTFPRGLPMSTFDPGTSAAAVAASALWGVPQSDALFSGVPWGLHEHSMFLSPAVAAGAATGLVLLAAASRNRGSRLTALGLLAYAALLTWACLSLIGGRGALPEALHSVPGLSAMRVMMRLLYPFSLVLCIGAVWALRAACHKLRWNADVAAAAAMLCTVAALPLAYAGALSAFDVRTTPTVVLERLTAAERAGFTRMPVTEVIDDDTDFLGRTGTQCSGDALFLSAGLQTVPGLVPGPVDAVRGGAFNLMNPACYAYPEANACRPGDRIADASDLRAFTTGGDPSWRLSGMQRAADAASAMMLALCVTAVVWDAAPRRRRVRSRT